MFEKIKIAQAQESGDIINNLQSSDQKMVELNSSLLDILDQYQEINFSQSSTSFFSFDNIYFWALLLGLLLLAISLGALFKELKKSSKTSKAQAKPLPTPIFNARDETKASDQTGVSQPIEKIQKKPIKIKVVKIKNKK